MMNCWWCLPIYPWKHLPRDARPLATYIHLIKLYVHLLQSQNATIFIRWRNLVDHRISQTTHAKRVEIWTEREFTCPARTRELLLNYHICFWFLTALPVFIRASLFSFMDVARMAVPEVLNSVVKQLITLKWWSCETKQNWLRPK